MQAPDSYRRLLAEALSGKPGALGGLLQYHHRELEAYVARHLPADLRANLEPQDIVQDVHLEAFRRIGSFHPTQDDSFFRWLLTIARHRMLDAIRSCRAAKRGGGRRVDNGPPRPLEDRSTISLLTDLRVYERTPSKSALSRELIQLLQRSLTQLSDEYRQALQLRYLDDLPVATIAQRMAKSEGAVHMICHRGIRALRGEITRLVGAELSHA